MSRLAPAPDWTAVPWELKELKQWVRWKYMPPDKPGGKPRKVPYRVDKNECASPKDPLTWGTFEEAQANLTRTYDGIGFVFAKDDPFFGFDLDDSLDEDGYPLEDARIILDKFHTYAEISPSGNGIKGIGRGRIPAEFLPPSGSSEPSTGFKVDGFEIYHERRFFTVTARVFPGMPQTCTEANGAIPWFIHNYIEPNRRHAPPLVLTPSNTQAVDPGERYKSTVPLDQRLRRAKAWLESEKTVGAISGSGGHNHTLRVAVNIVRGFQIPPDQAFDLLSGWNQTKCEPPWSDRELQHKISEAERIGDMAWGEKFANDQVRVITDESDIPQEWGPSEPDASAATEPPPPPPDTRRLLDPFDVLEELISQDTTIIPTPLPDLTRALGGGFETGHNIVFATQAGGGKTAILVQCAGFSALNGDSEGKPVFSVLALKDGNQRKDTARLAQMAGVDRWELRAKKPEAVKAAREAVQRYREKVKIYDVNQPGACFEDMLQRGLEWVDGRGSLIVGTDSIHVFPVADKAKEEAMQLYERIGYRLQAVHEAAIKHDILCLTVGQSGRSTYSKRKEEDNADLLTAVAGGHVAENSIDVLIVASKPRGDGLSYLVIPKSRLGGQGDKVPTIYDAKRSLWLAVEHTEEEETPKKDRVKAKEDMRAEAERKDQEDLAHYLKSRPEGFTVLGVSKALDRNRRWVSRVITGEFFAKKWVEQAKVNVQDSTGRTQCVDGWIWTRG